MKVEFKLVAENQEEIAKIAAFLKGEETVEKPKRETAKAKKAREAKEAKAAAAAKAEEGITLVPGGGEVETKEVPEPKQSVPTVEAEIVVEGPGPVAPTEITTPEMVRSIAKELIQTQRGAKVTEAIKSVGAESLSKVPEDKLTEVYHLLREIRKNG